jgi:hypothetical protein
VLAAVALAELTRRHHGTIARHAVRHGKRGALATARSTRSGARSAITWLAAKAGTRWEKREHRPLMFRRAPRMAATDPDSTADPGDDDVPPDTGPWVLTVRSKSGRPVNALTGGPADTITVWSRADLDRRLALIRQDPDLEAHVARPDDSTGGNTMTDTTTPPVQGRPRGRRHAIRAGGDVPAEWKALIGATADFEPEDDGHLLEWMAGQVAGMSGYAEALAEAYETGVNTVGLDPVSLHGLHDFADATAEAAQAMAAARQKFAQHYAEVREFAANGGLLPFDGRWIKGEGDA